MDKTLPGLDHKASLEPGELKHMVNAIRAVEQAIGIGVKIPAPEEVPNINIVRKSLVAANDIAKEEGLSLENITAKRDGTGISPMDIWHVLGKKVERSYSRDEKIVKS